MRASVSFECGREREVGWIVPGAWRSTGCRAQNERSHRAAPLYSPVAFLGRILHLKARGPPLDRSGPISTQSPISAKSIIPASRRRGGAKPLLYFCRRGRSERVCVSNVLTRGPRVAMEPSTKRCKRDAATKDWRWLLWDSGIAHERIHPELGAGWTAVLKEACCVGKDVDKDKVQRLRKDVNEPLRLWPRTKNEHGYWTTMPFPEMVVTIPLLEWCVARKYKPDAATFEATARGGNLDAVRWLRNKGCPWKGSLFRGIKLNACTGAAEGGHLDVLQWLREEGCPWDKESCAAAAEGGHLNVLQWIREHGLTWDEQTCSGAAKGGHLNILKLLRENGCPWNEKTCYRAAEGGHLDELKYLHENGCPWDKYMCRSAAKGGHLDVLKYAHENACPWNEYTFTCAACGGHVDVLKWMRKEGCPTSDEIEDYATRLQEYAQLCTMPSAWPYPE